MLHPDLRMISIDDHLVEHPAVWSDRLPSKFAESMPRIVELEGGIQQWCFEGVVGGPTGLNAVAGTPNKERGLDPPRYEDMMPGAYQPAARLADMDVDGAYAQLNFPSFPGFAGGRFLRAKDKELALACVRAWNDFAIEEWAHTSPERLLALIILPLWDAAESVAEIERCAPRGIRAISFPDQLAGFGWPSIYTDHWDGVFGAAQAHELPLMVHFGSSGITPPVSPDGPLAVRTATGGNTLFASMMDTVFSPVLHKFPALQIAYTESSIGWVPFALSRMDQVWEHYRFYKVTPTINADVRPSELFRRNMFVSFIDDPVGVEMRHLIGPDRILWETDYPHADSVWPHSREVAEKVFAGVADAEVNMMVRDNAAKLLKVKV